MKGRIFIFKTSFRITYVYFIIALPKSPDHRFKVVHDSGEPCKFGSSEALSQVLSHIFCVEEA